MNFLRRDIRSDNGMPVNEELKFQRKTDALVSEFDALVEETSARRDKPYVFNRDDAYEEILTEGLNDGQMYGTVKPVNPFKHSSAI